MIITRLCFIVLFCLLPLSCYSQSENLEPDHDPYNQYQGQNGQFFAALLSIPEVELSEFDKPSDQGPSVSLISTASCQDRIAFKLIFKNMVLTDGNVADVTYDFVMVKPDGTVYPDSKHSELPAYQGPVLVADNLFNSDATLIIEFEIDDMPGDYIAKAVIKDNNSDKDIRLSKRIKLLQCGEI